MNALNLGTLMKKEVNILALMLLTVPLAGELSFYPLNETFRISFGPPALFFFLLLLQKTPAILSGALTGTMVVLFRILIDFFTNDNFHWASTFQEQYPSFFFYFTYSFLFSLVKINRFQNRSLIIGFIGLIIEILSDTAELIIQYFVLETTIALGSLNEMIVIAFGHSFIVLSFFNMMKLYEAQSRERQIRKQNEHMLMLISNLYEETIHLRKTLKNAENITKESYDLYRDLKEREKREKQPHVLTQQYSQRALRIAGEMHEVKKDNQRIFAGLSKLISNESFKDYMEAAELIQLIIRINEKYALSLGKDIQFEYSLDGNTDSHYHVYTVLSLFNNLVANAVEAIKEKGIVSLSLSELCDNVEFKVADNGPGIPKKYQTVIFKPGFTSKYDHFGTPSTGIGLSYVKEVVKELGGDILLESKIDGAVFSIKLPIHKLIQKG
ncbi:sensor histidine kinase [Peribacillus simplex]|uniref:sensor histidine kinase n=1 Tax=Peribacillus simplex TaxID=1478 RepID=UPI0024C0FF1B|nr:sensor histidine kinase [Peribacillus simplex]MDR4928384.1 sensor histidine kinase [Peribacillus simplex]WHX93694.1 sensor histidine kinase [Peribacillus simplex]